MYRPAADEVRGLLARLDAIEDGVARTRVPINYSDYAYNLKLHIDLVRTKLQRMALGPDGGSGQGGRDS